jgi:hypothetical protein
MSKVRETLQSNLGSGYSVEEMYEDNEMGVYLILPNQVPARQAAVVHLQNIAAGHGTTFFIGSNTSYSGGLSSLSTGDLREAVGDDIFDALMERIR